MFRKIIQVSVHPVKGHHMTSNIEYNKLLALRQARLSSFIISKFCLKVQSIASQRICIFISKRFWGTCMPSRWIP